VKLNGAASGFASVISMPPEAAVGAIRLIPRGSRPRARQVATLAWQGPARSKGCGRL